VSELVPRPAWMSQAACKGLTALFFGERGEDRHSVAEARLVCAGCPVRVECLAYALEQGERFGVWGGATRDERRGRSQRRLRFGVSSDPAGGAIAVRRSQLPAL
jgi:WhiB family transcriptional regulator, redox-sensing transcriptional regulator